MISEFYRHNEEGDLLEVGLFKLKNKRLTNAN